MKDLITNHIWFWCILFIMGCFLYIMFRLYYKGKLHPTIAKPMCVVFHYLKLPFALALFELGLKKGKTPLWTQVDEFVWLGGYHGWQLSKFEGLGIEAVVNLCYETNGPRSWYTKKGIKHLHLPTIDHFEPTLIDIERAVDFIYESVQNRQRVYIHCFGGRGRSAAVAICYLMKMYGWEAYQAQQVLLKRRPLVRQKLYLQTSVKAFSAKHVSYPCRGRCVEDEIKRTIYYFKDETALGCEN